MTMTSDTVDAPDVLGAPEVDDLGVTAPGDGADAGDLSVSALSVERAGCSVSSRSGPEVSAADPAAAGCFREPPEVEGPSDVEGVG